MSPATFTASGRQISDQSFYKNVITKKDDVGQDVILFQYKDLFQICFGLHKTKTVYISLYYVNQIKINQENRLNLSLQNNIKRSKIKIINKH